LAWYREWFGEEYLELYSYRDEEEARQQILFLQEKIGPIVGPVLDLACGKGRHLQELAATGYRGVGCDLSFILLRAGHEEYGALPVTRADMRHLPFRSGSFGALVSFFTSFGYFATEEENAQVVSEMARVLASGAAFLFDYLNVHRELAQLVQRETRETESGSVAIERWFDPKDRSFNKRMTIGDKRYLERVRGYDLDEISAMFGACGLSIRNAFGDFAGATFNDSSPRLILVGTKSRSS
jgi:SAM-dependent methyltransferase